MTQTQIKHELIKLPPNERLSLARWLLDTVTVTTPDPTSDETNPLLKIASRFSGGSGDSAERVEEILAAEVDATFGLGVR